MAGGLRACAGAFLNKGHFPNKRKTEPVVTPPRVKNFASYAGLLEASEGSGGWLAGVHGGVVYLRASVGVGGLGGGGHTV